MERSGKSRNQQEKNEAQRYAGRRKRWAGFLRRRGGVVAMWRRRGGGVAAWRQRGGGVAAAQASSHIQQDLSSPKTITRKVAVLKRTHPRMAPQQIVQFLAQTPGSQPVNQVNLVQPDQ